MYTTVVSKNLGEKNKLRFLSSKIPNKNYQTSIIKLFNISKSF